MKAASAVWQRVRQFGLMISAATKKIK